MRSIRHIWRNARKRYRLHHRCCLCGECIYPRERHKQSTYVDGDEFMVTRTCRFCDEFCRERLQLQYEDGITPQEFSRQLQLHYRRKVEAPLW